jgi:tetratricopeptide (TPR) repeat protein
MGLGTMNLSKYILTLCLAGLLGAWGGIGFAGADQDPSIVLHFETGKVFLSAAEKNELQHFFQTYDLGSKGRVFVVGYTDATGTKTENDRLSRKRADAVRHEIVGVLGIDTGIVMSLSKGSRSPVANNRTVQGRALNRRVEVYLANAQIRKPPRVYGPGDPYLSKIQDILKQVDEAIKARRMTDALQKLKIARELGADHYAQWQALAGISGYYAGADPDETRAHLISAINLDPFNADAREYLDRVEARIKVAKGDVTKTMGHTIETAIPVSAMAQQYEFLRLFEVEPLTHRKLEARSVDMWQCVDRQGAPAVYYFNDSQAYRRAFARSAAANPLPGKHGSPSSSTMVSGTGKASPSAAAPGDATISPAQKKSGRIWESKIFK